MQYTPVHRASASCGVCSRRRNQVSLLYFNIYIQCIIIITGYVSPSSMYWRL